MTQSAAAETFTITRRAVDPRADGAVRTVHLSASRVTIDRTLDGVRMRLGVPTAAYRELVISVLAGPRPARDGARDRGCDPACGHASGRAVLRLRHDDAELDVVIGSGEAEEVARSARAWSAVTGKAVSVEFGAVVVGAPLARARSARPGRRRGRLGRFASRRKPGVAERLAVSFAGEREIVARS